MAKKKRYTVRVAYKVYDYYDVEATSEKRAIEMALEQSADDSLNDFIQDGEGEGLVTIINGKPVKPKYKENEMEVLFAVDKDDNYKHAICVMKEKYWKDDSKRLDIEKALKDFLGDRLKEYFEDDYFDDLTSQEEKESEFENTVDLLAGGGMSDFMDYELYWETVTSI